MDHDENLPPSRQREILQQRKIAKPLMEKRRRERINNCLEQLKSLLTEVTKKLDDDEEENSYRSKLEKADILEMTVNYLKSVKRQKMTTDAISSSTSSADPASSSSSSSSSSIHSRYVAGFRECAQQVAKYLEKADGLSATTRSTIIQHLTRRLHHQHQHHQQHQQHHQHQHHHQHQQQSISTSTIHPKHSNYLSATTSSTASSSSSSSSPRLMMISSPASTAPPPHLPPPPLPPAAVGFVVQTPPSFSSVNESIHSTSVVPSHHPIQLLPVQLATGETVFVLANANDLIPLTQQIHILTEQTMTTTTGGTKQTNEATIQQSMDTAENNGIVIYEAISPAVVSPLQISQQNNHIDHPNPPLSYPCSTSSSTSSSADVYGKLQMMNYPPPHPPLVKSDQSGTQWNSLFKSATAASEFDPLESKCPPSAGDCRALLSADCFSSSSIVDGRPILLPLPQIDTNAMAVSDTCHQMSDDPCQVWRPW